jgi:CPA2 family monovalent cation:H+ antiporter-2
MHQSPLFVQILILFGCSTILITLFYRLKLPALLAFLLVGAGLGPTGLGVIKDPSNLHDIAELGLAFLLFLLGLEFSLPRLIALRDTVLKLGGAQVAICTASFGVAFYWWGLAWETAFIVGGALALSSTAIVSRELSQLGQLSSRHGQIAIGILLFQDIVAVFLISAIPILAAGEQASLNFTDMLIPLLKGAGLLIGLLAIGRFVLPVLLAEVARTRSEELLVLSALVIVLAAGMLTVSVGLSMALGAFIAGMMLGESRFRRQLESDVRPFRDILLGLFFISIGMLVDTALVMEYWFRILVSGVLLLVFKSLTIALIARLMKESWRNAIPAGLVLGQGGEFLFALLALASRDNLIAKDVAAFLISVTVVSMVLTPFVIRYAISWTDYLLQRLQPTRHEDSSRLEAQISEQHTGHLDHHVIILGFGRVGQTIARFLKQQQIPYIALEVDTVRISEAYAADEPVFYGDPSRLDILKISGIERAALVAISFDDAKVAEKIIPQIRSLNGEVPILTRTRDDSNLSKLLDAGATEVVPETLEAGLMLVSHVLLLLKTPASTVYKVVSEARRNRYHLLHGFYHGARLQYLNRHGEETELLHAVPLPEGAWAVNKTLSQLNFPVGSELQEVHRQEESLDLHADLLLLSQDVLIIRGSIGAVEKAEDYCLTGIK